MNGERRSIDSNGGEPLKTHWGNINEEALLMKQDLINEEDLKIRCQEK